VTPGELKSGGEGLEIAWGVHPTPFGQCLVGTTARGICELAFVEPDELPDRLAEMKGRWPAAVFRQDPHAMERPIRAIFAGEHDASVPITVLLRGTNFQLQVWRALLEIPPGEVTTYGEVARSIGAPRSARAVGTAIGANKIAFLIPCHRVIRGTSAFGKYRWGASRKRAILAWEQSLAAP
ncbi:MAG TPA: methylated-DNA--[protein]-cysteine S-methyltransferase, partial [Longimicrobiaceae bacterium]|nr:methylated-DNA--[protein]-cysteine S-methyltransferase [Longimicrobiaceae bacterium]